MTDKPNNGGPAFPTNNAPGFYPGLSKRDYFAAAALPGVIVQCANDLSVKAMVGDEVTQTPEQYFAERAFAVADAMLAAGGHDDD